MSNDIDEIRAELNKVRDDVRLFFADVEKSNPETLTDLWDRLSEKEQDRGYHLRRRIRGIMFDVRQAVNNRDSFMVTDSMLSEFRWHAEQAAGATQFRHFTGDLPLTDDPEDPGVPYRTIDVKTARREFEECCQQAKALLRSISGSRQLKREAPVMDTALAPASAIKPRESSAELTREQLVDNFIQKAWAQRQVKITRRDIWRAAKHETARQFQYWQSGDDRATDADDRNFGRILAMEPSEFVQMHHQPAKKSAT